MASRKSGPCDADVARALPLQPIGVGAAAVDVVHEDRVAVLRRPGVAAEVDHRAGVRVAAAGRRRSAVAGVRPLPSDPVHVIGDGLDVVVGVRVEVLARLPLVARALDDVVQVLDDARGRERMAVVVEVEAPRIAGAFGEHLEDVLRRMVAPDAAVQLLALGVRRAGLADVRVREHAVRSVEPAIGAPGEGVEHLVRVLIAPAVEQHLRRARRTVRPVLDRNEQQVRRRADPHAAEADLDAADEIQVLGEDLAAVEASVAVGVFEDQDAVLALAFGRAQSDRCALRRPTAGRGRRARSAIGRTTSGSAAASLTVKPFGTVIALAASTADRPACGIGSIGGSVLISDDVISVGKNGLESWKRKWSKLMCAHGTLFQIRGHRRPGLVVHQPNDDVLADSRP